MHVFTLGIRDVAIVYDHRQHHILRRLARRRRVVANLTPLDGEDGQPCSVQVSIRSRMRSHDIGELTPEDAALWWRRIRALTTIGNVVRLPAAVVFRHCDEIWIGEELT
ncbi:hypothetical protein FGL91_15855 [Microbacterium sp. CBA3102]|uniref:hypothetical protein n=1 Tax=Microbacterium sp. CBA3102 TaxID=2603598 RepID=UPI0011BBA3D2|nr:hypothetical protein [Microbacterium sp. CBA3102]QEA29891.1 hypothetical protein FGL91_15855 [Microbacterium sp. CBA3102]